MSVRDVDVGDGCRRIERNQVDLSNGHWIKDSAIIPVIPSSTEETFYFERKCDFNCLKMPTSWLFRITFTRFSNAEVSAVAVIRRTDEGSGLVDVQLRTTVRQLTTENTCAVHIFKGVTPGQVERSSAKDFIRRFDAERSAGQKLPVEFFVSVNACHNEQDMPSVGEVETMNTDDSEDSSVRKREHNMDIGDSEDSSPKKRLRVHFSVSD